MLRSVPHTRVPSWRSRVCRSQSRCVVQAWPLPRTLPGQGQGWDSKAGLHPQGPAGGLALTPAGPTGIRLPEKELHREFNLVLFLLEPGCPWRPTPSWGSESLPVAKEKAGPRPRRCQVSILIKSIFSLGGRLPRGPGHLPRCPQERQTCASPGPGAPTPMSPRASLPQAGPGVPTRQHRVQTGAQH